MKKIRRSLLLACMITFHQFILADSQQIPSLQAQQQQQQHSTMEDISGQQQGEKEQLLQQQQQQRALRGVPNKENLISTSSTIEQTAHSTRKSNDDNHQDEKKKDHERQERRRRELRERHIKERARIQRILQEQDTIDVIVTLDESIMGQESAAAASDFERTNAKIMTVNISQYQAMQHDPTILLVEVDALVYPQQQQQEQQQYDESEVFSLQSMRGKEYIPWNVAAVLQHDFTTIPSTPQPMVVAASTTSMGASCSVKVCVIDSGCLVDHPDLPFQKGDGRIQGHEFDIGTSTWDRPIFYSYHGTHVVGTMMAEGNNNQGSRGIIPQARENGVCLLVARVFGDGPLASAKTSTIEMAAEWCADQGAQVINLSLASYEPSSNSAEIYRRMEEEENLLIVAASGNAGSDEYAYPASYDNVISVGSVNAQMQKSDFSQYNNQVSLVAPGENILSTVPSHSVMNAAGDVLFESSTPLVFSPLPNQVVTGSIFNCGLGETLCEGARGKVCLVQLGGTTAFETKAENCEDAGSIAVLISDEAGRTGMPHAAAFLSMNSRISIPVLSVSYDDRERFLQETQPVTINYVAPAYRSVDGTSMAAPHVSAVAARIWAARRQCTNAQIRQALQETALDLGPVGYDDSYGHGFVQATAAYYYLLNQPEPCGISGGAPPYVPPIQPVVGGGTMSGGGSSGGTANNGGGGGGNTNAVFKRKTPGANANKNDLRLGYTGGRNRGGGGGRGGAGGVPRYLGDELLNTVRGGRQSVVTIATATTPITVP